MNCCKLFLCWGILIAVMAAAAALSSEETSLFDPQEIEFILADKNETQHNSTKSSTYISPATRLLDRLGKRNHSKHHHHHRGHSVDSHERDSVLDEHYKPWGAASLRPPQQNQDNVILDKVDEDELFPPQSEVHTYDQQQRIQPPLY